MTFSAHGKVILLGEHAVVYGHPALAGALSGGVIVELAPGRGRLLVPAWELAIEPTVAADDARSLARAYRALRDHLGVGGESPSDLVVRFGIPAGAGLGSSAALAVAVARALSSVHGLSLDARSIAEAAMASETVVHGRPSGLDHTVAQQGGFGLFTRANGLERIESRFPLRLVVGHTGRERDTRGRVARVAELFAERNQEVQGRFEAIRALVERGRAAVERGSAEELGAAMNANQEHLDALEVSCEEIARMCALATRAGAAGAKLTGGGGGGCVIALGPGREAEIQRAWEQAGFRSFIAEVGAGAAAPGASGASGSSGASEVAA